MHTYITISPPSCLSLPPSLSHTSRWSQSTELISLCYAAASHQLSSLHLVTRYMSMLLSHFVPAYPSPSPCPQVHSLRLHLYSCPAPVSDLMFKSLIHFEFIFVYGVNQWSSFILLHVAVQFSQYHLLNRLSFPHCIFLAPLS